MDVHHCPSPQSQDIWNIFEVFLKWSYPGYPQFSSILDGDFPWNKPSNAHLGYSHEILETSNRSKSLPDGADARRERWRPFPMRRWGRMFKRHSFMPRSTSSHCKINTSCWESFFQCCLEELEETLKKISPVLTVVWILWEGLTVCHFSNPWEVTSSATAKALPDPSRLEPGSEPWVVRA